ncbi:hypothetical protein JDW15_02165 [Aerococcaceae bacterium zg-ZJ1578]|uniref:hypothetical protein n=1 Tax=Aerococcaceae bacterium zg-252 TaxID=2796928 RepID=UPI001A23CF99|nr:hypothetical protein [Aerococcaceae bacterium zg-1578]MBR7926582.1 hypothetical protein [Aerococcaceae bacterium zg-ZUI334]
MNRKRVWLLFKVIFIAVVWLMLYLPNQEAIQSIIQQDNQSTLDKVVQVTRQLLNLPLPEKNISSEIIGTNQTTFTTPRQFNPAVYHHNNFQYAERVAQQFNQDVNLDELNRIFVSKINEKYNAAKSVGPHLAEGTIQRAAQLSDFHYLNTETVNGESFASLFEIPQAETRISEYLYELHIVATDVHLKIWKNSEILADYLLKALEKNNFFNHEQQWVSQYIAIKVAASDYLVDKSPYVRMVLVLTMDTQ